MSSVEEYVAQIGKVAEQHAEYKTEAYHFVMAGLNFTLADLKEHRHVSGQELSVGIRDYALEQFGPLAGTVLNFWGIHETYDFGKIVYYLIDAKLMSKAEEDSVEDFRDVYSFEKIFDANYDYLELDSEEKC